MSEVSIYKHKMVAVDNLHPHPRNYRDHPDEQLEHLAASIKEHGFYRNVVAAKDGTILAGHGVVQAAQRLGLERIPVIRLDVGPDDPRALKVLTGDNAIANLSEDDDQMLVNLLRELAEDGGLLGTGFNADALESLAHIADALEDLDEFDPHAEWSGMPEYVNDNQKPVRQVIVSFANAEDVSAFAKLTGAQITDKRRSIWWPRQEIVSGVDTVYEVK